MKVICINDGKDLPNYDVSFLRGYLTIGKSYEVVGEGRFSSIASVCNGEPYYEIISDYNDTKIAVRKIQFKTVEEIREEKLNLLNII